VPRMRAVTSADQTCNVRQMQRKLNVLALHSVFFPAIELSCFFKYDVGHVDIF